MADALEAVTSLTSLNGCDQYAAIRKGGMRELTIRNMSEDKELGVWAGMYLERSASTLTELDLRCLALCLFGSLGTLLRLELCSLLRS